MQNKIDIEKAMRLKRDVDFTRAIKTIRNELSNKDTIYDGFVSSVEGCLKDNGVLFLPFDTMDEHKLAIAIVDRLAGIE